MSGWSPFSGITYPQYQQGASYVRDITDAVTVSNKSLQKSLSKNISTFTTQVVASQQSLSREFQSSYDQLNNTLTWGINRLSDDLKDISWAIEDFRADFTYSMGLLLVEMQTHNKILQNIAVKLDGIHDTLKHPLLTQAREYFSIGEDRLKRKLLQKALESFNKARELNDADFFVEYQLGNIYLFGADDDENLIDLNKAKSHLLNAVLFSKAEMNIAPEFSKFAAEALLKVSFVNFFQLTENNLRDKGEESKKLLLEAKKLASESYELNPKLLESLYHICKYDTLLGNTEDLITNLKKLIYLEPKYSVKIVEDDVFNPAREVIETLLNELKSKNALEYSIFQKKINDFEQKVSIWYDLDLIVTYYTSDWHNLSNMIKDIRVSALRDTFLDYVYSLKMIDTLIPKLDKFQKELIQSYEHFLHNIDRDLTSFINTANYKKKYQGDSLEKLAIELQSISAKIENNVAFKFLKSHNFIVGFDKNNPETVINELKKIKMLSIDADKIQSEIWSIEKKLDKEFDDKIKRGNRRKANLPKYTWNGAKFGVIMGIIAGCAQPVRPHFGAHFLTYLNAVSGALGGLIIGVVLGAFLAYISGNDK